MILNWKSVTWLHLNVNQMVSFIDGKKRTIPFSYEDTE
jgi:hypothetical protein